MENQLEIGYVDRQTSWICVQIQRRGNPWFQKETLNYTRKGSIELLLKNSSVSWDDCKKNGWLCKKVIIELITLN
jgi:hypothetical protein